MSFDSQNFLPLTNLDNKRRKLNVKSTLDHNSSPSRIRSSIFRYYRTIGLISPTSVGFTCVAKGNKTFQITTSCGRSLHTYDLRKGLHLQFISQPQTPGPINATLAWQDQVFAAWSIPINTTTSTSYKLGLWSFQRGIRITQAESPPSPCLFPIGQLVKVGCWLVASTEYSIEVWKHPDLTYHSRISPQTSSHSLVKSIYNSTTLCSLPTYLNKVFLARKDGFVDICNVNTGKLVYSLKPVTKSWGSITALSPAPVISLLVIAYESGPIVIHNVKTDKSILQLNTGPVPGPYITTISPRTDGLGAGDDGRLPGILATASIKSGDITLWDLNNGGRKAGILRAAHTAPIPNSSVSGGISKVQFLPGQSILVSSGQDNSLKTWIFDLTPFSPIPRPLHCKIGHSGDITCLEFLPDQCDDWESSGKWLLSGSLDRSLRAWSLRNDNQNFEVSQGNLQHKANKFGLSNSDTISFYKPALRSVEDLKAPPIESLTCSLNRDGGMNSLSGTRQLWVNSRQNKSHLDTIPSSLTGWESMLTCHENDKFARTWSWGAKRAGRWKFESSDGSFITSIGISSCGTFGFIGSANGLIEAFNLQSGAHRQTFPALLRENQLEKLGLNKSDLTKVTASSRFTEAFINERQRHKGPVTGIHVDNLNKVVISCGQDGCVKFWNFATGQVSSEMSWPDILHLKFLAYNRNTDWLLIRYNDQELKVLDIGTRQLVRVFTCPSTILCAQFSHDGRWIIAACTDACIRVWDLPTANLVDILSLPRPCTALAFSPTGAFLAVALRGCPGISIWSNRTLFLPISLHNLSESTVTSSSVPHDLQGSPEPGEIYFDDLNNSQDLPYDNSDNTTDTPDIITSALVQRSNLDQLDQSLLTLSLIPRPKWQTLLHLDLIRERNKAREPVNLPQQVPFFLTGLIDKSIRSSTHSDSPGTLLNPSSSWDPTYVKSHILANPTPLQNPQLTSSFPCTATNDFQPGPTDSLYHFNQLMNACLDQPDSSPLRSRMLDYLATLPPPAADTAISTMNSTLPFPEFVQFILALTERLTLRLHVDLTLVWMRVFIRHHANPILDATTLSQNTPPPDTTLSPLVSALKEWRSTLHRETHRLSQRVNFCIGMANWLRGHDAAPL